ncbi:MAG: hypothetical protein OHK0023_19310 [Anaerolineae bacterium]
MPANIMQCNYPDFEKLGQQFVKESEQTVQLFRTIQRHMDSLERQGWIGRGADSFYREMESEVMPAVNRLGNALQDAGSAVKRIVDAWRKAEDEAASLFTGEGQGGTGGGNGANSGNSGSGGTGGPDPIDPRYQPVNGTQGNTVPAYMINFNDPNFNMDTFIQNLDTDGRPVIFMVHGFREQEGDVTSRLAQASNDYSQMYDSGSGNGKPPIIIGVHWNAGTDSISPTNYWDANSNAARISPRFGDAIESFRQFHPESQVNVIAHSLGNRFVLEGLASNPNARVDNYLGVQPAVDAQDFQAGRPGWFGTSIGGQSEGRFYDLVNGPQIGNMAATYNTQDRALWAHYVSGDRFGSSFDTALGGTSQSFDGIDRISLQTGWANTDMNHFSWHEPQVMNIATRYFGMSR